MRNFGSVEDSGQGCRGPQLYYRRREHVGRKEHGARQQGTDTK